MNNLKKKFPLILLDNEINDVARANDLIVQTKGSITQLIGDNVVVQYEREVYGSTETFKRL